MGQKNVGINNINSNNNTPHYTGYLYFDLLLCSRNRKKKLIISAQQVFDSTYNIYIWDILMKTYT